MIPLKLELRNFMAYREADPLDMSGLHVVCLTGDNGAGKSTLLDAMTWALWGQSRAGRDDELIAQGAADMKVEFTFSEGRETFRVIRTRKMGKAGKGKAATSSGSLDLLIHDAALNGWRTLTESRVADTQATIERVLNLSYDTFINSAYLKQGRADEFTVKPAGQRKQLLAEILNLDVWAEYEERVKQRLSSVEREHYRTSQDLESVETDLAQLPQYERQLGEAQAALEAAKAASAAIEVEYSEVVALRERVRGLRSQAAQAEQRMQGVAAEVQRARAEHERTLEQVKRLQEALSQREEIEAGYAALLQAQAENEQFNVKLTSIVDLNARKTEVESRIAAERRALEGALQEATRRVEELRAKVNVGEAQRQLEQVQARLRQMADASEKSAAANQRRVQIAEESSDLRSRNKALKDEMDQIKARMEALKKVGAVCPTCGRELHEDDRARLLDEWQARGRERGDLHRANQALLKQYEDDRSALDSELEAYAALLRGQQAAQREEGIQAERCARAAEAQAALPAAEQAQRDAAAALSADAYAADARAELRQVEAELAELGYDAAAHKQVRDVLLPRLQPYASRKPEVERAESGLQLQEEKASILADQISLLQAREADERREQDRLRRELAEHEATLTRAGDVQQKVAAAQIAVQECQSRYGAANQRVQACRSQEVRATKLTADLQALVRRQANLEELRAAFGKNGVPAMIIESALPELEAAANELLGRMTNGRMNVRFDTQRLTQKGDTQETLEIRIADEVGERSYEMFSGGEAFRINFAVRIALSRLLARRAGAALRTLFIDEGFGTQDAQGRERLVEAIKAIEGDFERIFVITHIDELKDAFPARIEVTKSARGSTARVL